MSRQSTPAAVTTIGIDLGKNTFHLVGLDQRGNIVLRLKTSRNQSEQLPARGLRDGMKRWTNGLPGATTRLGDMMTHLRSFR